MKDYEATDDQPFHFIVALELRTTFGLTLGENGLWPQ